MTAGNLQMRIIGSFGGCVDCQKFRCSSASSNALTFAEDLSATVKLTLQNPCTSWCHDPAHDSVSSECCEDMWGALLICASDLRLTLHIRNTRALWPAFISTTSLSKFSPTRYYGWESSRIWPASLLSKTSLSDDMMTLHVHGSMTFFAGRFRTLDEFHCFMMKTLNCVKRSQQCKDPEPEWARAFSEDCPFEKCLHQGPVCECLKMSRYEKCTQGHLVHSKLA